MVENTRFFQLGVARVAAFDAEGRASSLATARQTGTEQCTRRTNEISRCIERSPVWWQRTRGVAGAARRADAGPAHSDMVRPISGASPWNELPTRCAMWASAARAIASWSYLADCRISRSHVLSRCARSRSASARDNSSAARHTSAGTQLGNSSLQARCAPVRVCSSQILASRPF